MENLPAELKLLIADQLDPESCLDFALTCKEHYRLFQSILSYHTEQFLKWGFLHLDQATMRYRNDMPHSIWSVLKAVLRDPRKGWYIKDLRIYSSRGTSLYTGEKYPISPIYNEDQIRINEALRALRELYPPGEDEIAEGSGFFHALELDDQNEDNARIITILIHYLPNLKTLRVTDKEIQMLLDVINKIPRGLQDPLKANKMPLQRLRTAFISHWGTEDGCDSGWARGFARLPSLRTFVADRMGDEPRDNNPSYIEPVIFSNITEIFLDCSRLGENILNAILAGAQALRRFTYEIGGYDVAGLPYEPKMLLEAIVSHTKDTLEELTLSLEEPDDEANNEETTETASLRDFKKLRMLNCRWSMLRPDQYEENEEALDNGFYKTETPIAYDVTAILPASLESFYLHGTYEDVDWAMLKTILDPRSPELPNLAKVYFTKSFNLHTNEVEEMWGNTHPPRSKFDHPLYSLFDGNEF